MGDLKTNWPDPIYPDTGDLSGDLATSRGTDANVDGGSGGGAVQEVWPADKQVTTRSEIAETPNSVSGLPAQPNRFQPAETPPPPPSLEDRNPGTIDQR